MERKGKRVLIIEDDFDVATLLAYRLQLRGCDVHRVADGSEAVAAVEQYHPELIFLDLMLPGINGLGVLQFLKRSPELRQIPIVILTALSDPLVRLKALAAGAEEVVVKNGFLKAVDRWVGYIA